ncbi:MAG: hypothetical protein EHM28_04240 [Spirochaetaceae bacterium]|nr:MAG: hypothetical protein EHM28_04240 [Spirochaetaceae bacterium]
MKRIFVFCLICISFLFQMSCDPSSLSIFPSYLTDTEIFKNMGSGHFFPDSGKVEFYKLRVENPIGPASTEGDVIMLMAFYYNGDRRLIVLDDDFSVMYDGTDGRFGTRMHLDDNGNYVVGGAVGTYGGSTITWNNMPTSGLGNSGYAGLWNNSNYLFSGWVSSGNLSILPMTDTWLATAGAEISYPTPFPYDVSILYAKTLYDANVLGMSDHLTLLAFRNDETGFGQIRGRLQTIAFEWRWPPDEFKVRIGESVRVVDEGIICHIQADNRMHLIGWNWKDIASTDFEGRFNDVAFDFGRMGYYYIFDPASRRLFKVRNWWL